MFLRRAAFRLTTAFLLLGLVSSVKAQLSPVDPLHQFGDGEIHSIQWQADAGDDPTLLIATHAGAFFFTPELELKHQMPGVRLVSFSPNGRFLAGIESNDLATVRIWDVKTYSEVTSLAAAVSVNTPLTILSWSTDGNYLASHNLLGDLCMIEVKNWTLLTCRQGYRSDKLLWSPDSTYIGLLNSDQGSVSILVIDAKSLRDIFGQQRTYFSPYSVDIIWHTDYELLIAENTETPEVSLWDVVTGEELEPPIKAYDYIYSPQRDKLVTTGPTWDARVSDVSSGESLFTVLVREEHFGTQSVAWSDDGMCLAVGTYDYSYLKRADIYIVDAATGEVRTSLDNASQEIDLLEWSSDGRYIAAVDGRQQLFVYQIDQDCQSNGEPIGLSQQFAQVGNTFVWSADSTQLAIADLVDGVTLYDIEGDKQLLLSQSGYEMPVSEMQWQPKGTLLAAKYPNQDDVTRTLDLWETTTGQLHTEDLHLPQDVSVSLFDWSNNGQKLALQTEDAIVIWDSVLRQNTLIENEISGFDKMEWSLSDKYLGLFPRYSVTPGYIYDFDRKGVTQHNIGVDAGDFRWILGDQVKDKLIRWIWRGGVHSNGNPITPSLIHYVYDDYIFEQSSYQFTGLTKPIAAGFLSPSATYGAATTEDDLGLIWDLATGDPVTMLSGTKRIVWSPDETRLIIQRTDGSLWLMTAQGEFLAELLPADGNFSEQDQVLWSPDSQQIAFRRAGVVSIWKISDVLRP
jgi:WD40 repeat protein